MLRVRKYDVSLDLTGLQAGEGFSSRTVVRFDARKGPRGSSTWIDLVAREVRSVRLNGRHLDPARFADSERIALVDLAGSNELVVESEHRADTPTKGLTRSVDPVDGQVYVWTQFQPFEARRVFACFDQPDLKATFAFTVRVPRGWHCVSGTREQEVTVDGESATWVFPATRRLSPFTTAVCAGPFHRVEDASGPIPLALYARQSLGPHLDRNAADLFDLTRRGLDVFAWAFGSPFDGDSYDHVFLADQPGAMENHGCVTWNDQALHRSAPTAERRRSRDLVLLHELSHMWFGNLVSPAWWDALWLSESFANWAALWCSAQLDPAQGTWSVSNALEKERAVAADQVTATTHPVWRHVPDIPSVEASFDDITYAKGSCVLRQLVHLVGEDAFLAGLRRYFRAHGGGNARPSDLLAAIAAETHHDLDTWSHQWLQTSGINTLTLDLAMSDEGTAVTVRQSSGGPEPLLRRHRLAVGAYRLDRSGRLQLSQDTDLLVDGASTAVPGLGVLAVERQPDLLLLDHHDQAYAKLRLDGRSLALLLESGHTLQALPARAVARRIVRDMLLDGELGAGSALEFSTSCLRTELDATHLGALTALALEAAGRFAPAGSRLLLQERLADACLGQLDAVPQQSQAWLTLADALTQAATSSRQLAAVGSLMDAGTLPSAQRWQALTRLAALGFAVEEAIEAEERKDDDPDSFWRAAAARAACGTTTAKDAAHHLMLEGDAVPAGVLPALAQAFWQFHQEELLAPYADEFVRWVAAASVRIPGATLRRVVQLAFPLTGVDDRLLTEVEGLAHREAVPPAVAGALLDQADRSRRALLARTRPDDFAMPSPVM